ncbi:HNH endonuclease signature motif containing protein [Microbacterium paludicola]|uniref:HNH endonuclease n=1 Tax=Microbacterium paludicola TaxID=300019 RepID=UPI0009FF7A33
MSRHSARGADWNATRLRVLDRDGWVCTSCGKELVGDDATVDHITPVSQGGSSEDWNLTSLCRKDNSTKGDRELQRVNWFNTRWLTSIR